MKWFKLSAYSILIFLVIINCQKKVVTKKEPQLKPEPKPIVIPDSGQITVANENVRAKPNGRVLGQVHKGEPIDIRNKIGNWLYFYNARFDSAYVWAPSAGFDYINLHSPYTYYDTTTQKFYSKHYIQQLIGTKGKIIEDNKNTYQLFFTGLGLGSHETVVMEVADESTQTVEHGITVFVQRKPEEIYQVKIDFNHPIDGFRKALKKCNLPYKKPTENNEGHVIWDKGRLVPDLTIDLERKVWKSKLIRSIWFKK